MSILYKKAFNLGEKAIAFSGSLKQLKEFEIASQILRSGCSIGANISEAYGAESKRDFIHKLHISLKEARELAHWLKLVAAVFELRNEDLELLVNEVQAMLVSSIKTAKSKLNK